ncbi:MAG TPA: hypothetical protein VKI00_15245 [Mycobacterium sp.]|nr:hypothetical protein [Mycobacterium sp.]
MATDVQPSETATGDGVDVAEPAHDMLFPRSSNAAVFQALAAWGQFESRRGQAKLTSRTALPSTMPPETLRDRLAQLALPCAGFEIVVSAAEAWIPFAAPEQAVCAAEALAGAGATTSSPGCVTNRLSTISNNWTR